LAAPLKEPEKGDLDREVLGDSSFFRRNAKTPIFKLPLPKSGFQKPLLGKRGVKSGFLKKSGFFNLPPAGGAGLSQYTGQVTV
jgi:hypothetical protein